MLVCCMLRIACLNCGWLHFQLFVLVWDGYVCVSAYVADIEQMFNIINIKHNLFSHIDIILIDRSLDMFQSNKLYRNNEW